MGTSCEKGGICITHPCDAGGKAADAEGGDIDYVMRPDVKPFVSGMVRGLAAAKRLCSTAVLRSRETRTYPASEENVSCRQGSVTFSNAGHVVTRQPLNEAAQQRPKPSSLRKQLATAGQACALWAARGEGDIYI